MAELSFTIIDDGQPTTIQATVDDATVRVSREQLTPVASRPPSC
jgi:hypothetical protein